MTVAAWLLSGAVLLLLALVLVQIHRANRNEERIIVLEDWARKNDPEEFEIYPELEPEPPTPDCEEQGGFHVAGDGKTCQNCPAVLV